MLAGGAQELCLHIKSNKSKQEERERGAQTSVGQNLVMVWSECTNSYVQLSILAFSQGSI